MTPFEIVYTRTAKNDINILFDVIVNKYQAPLTAFKYVQGLYDEIKNLSISADSYPVQNSKTLHQYGTNTRRINYKKMAIIYTLNNNIVYIQRIIPSNTVKCVL